MEVYIKTKPPLNGCTNNTLASRERAENKMATEQFDDVRLAKRSGKNDRQQVCWNRHYYSLDIANHSVDVRWNVVQTQHKSSPNQLEAGTLLGSHHLEAGTLLGSPFCHATFVCRVWSRDDQRAYELPANSYHEWVTSYLRTATMSGWRVTCKQLPWVGVGWLFEQCEPSDIAWKAHYHRRGW